MNNTDISTMLAAVGGVIATMGGFEFIKWLFNRKNNARIAAAQAFEIEYKTIMNDYKRIQSEIDLNKKEIAELNRKVNQLHEKVHELETDKLQLMQENNTLKLQLKEAEKHVCMQPDDKCLKRLGTPINCRLRDLLRGEYAKDHPGAILTDEDMLNTK